MKKATTVNLPAPIGGLVLEQSLKDPRGAEHLDNWWPTKRGIKVRGGLQHVANASGTVVSLFEYNHPTNGALFAGTATTIDDISGLNPSITAPSDVTGQTAGYYSAPQIGTSGGDFLIAVNGADQPLKYDGANWEQIWEYAAYELDYDAETAPFTVGETLTGGTSSATAKIMAVTDNGTTGTLIIGNITGTFQDNETITDGAGGSADADGTVTQVSSTGVESADLTAWVQGWLYRNRLLFIRKNTLIADYLPTGAIGGTAAQVSLAGVFQRGGSLKFGATWSIDSGAGLDDKCVFVSTEGEVAVYRGSDPSDADDWVLEGRYDMGKPLGIKAHMRAGGDIVIATVDGMVPLSQVIQKDPAALSLAAVSRRIEPLWTRESASATSPWEVIKWTDRNLGLVTVPDSASAKMLGVHLETGSWGVATGWSGVCGAYYAGQVYIATGGVKVYAADETGADDGVPFTAKYCGAFGDYGMPVAYKMAQMMRGTFLTYSSFSVKVSTAMDYSVDFPTAPSALPEDASDFLVWDVGNWDEKLWYASNLTSPQQSTVLGWESVSGAGYTIAPVVQVTSGGSTRTDCELIAVDMIIEMGTVAV